jgi:hypothetical protein
MFSIGVGGDRLADDDSGVGVDDEPTCATPVEVGTNIRSVVQRGFGAVAVKSRRTNPGCLTAAWPGIAVLRLFGYLTTSLPKQYSPHFGCGNDLD